MHATLELLPMWSGVDPDVELFASGDVAEEDDEWKGGHSLDGSAATVPDAGEHTSSPQYQNLHSFIQVELTARHANRSISGPPDSCATLDATHEHIAHRHRTDDGQSASASMYLQIEGIQVLYASGAEGGSSGAAAADGKAPGMRLCLSQIREWVVEYSADTLFISMRTSVAWYRLTTCGPTPLPCSHPSHVTDVDEALYRLLADLQKECTYEMLFERFLPTL